LVAPGGLAGEQDKMYKKLGAAGVGTCQWQLVAEEGRFEKGFRSSRGLLFRGNGQAGGRGKGRCLLMGLLARPLLPVATTGRRAEHAQCPVAVDEYSAGAAS